MAFFLSSMVLVILLILMHAFFIITEFGGVAARRALISQKEHGDHWLTKILMPVLQDAKSIDGLLAVSQIGLSLSILALGMYGYHTLVPVLLPYVTYLSYLFEGMALPLTIILVWLWLTILQVIFGKFIPKVLALHDPERAIQMIALPLRLSVILFNPLVWLFNESSRLILRRWDIDLLGETILAHSAGEIKKLVSESYQGGQINHKERRMVRNALRLRELTARQIMVPRTRLVAAPVDSTVIDLIHKVIEHGLSRLPIYNNTIDHIIGFVHIKDLFSLQLKGETNSSYLLREVVYVPESLPIAQVWETLNRQRQYLAIVFDEHGGTAGIITFEDLIEEIFGDLQDEFDDQETALISHDRQGLTRLRADLLISDLNEHLNLSLPEENADTVGGLIYTELERQPQKGDEIMINDTCFRVEEIDDIVITEISLKLPTHVTLRVREWEKQDYA